MSLPTLEPQIMYSHKQYNRRLEREEYWDVHPHPKMVKLYREGEIFKVSVREANWGENTIYWGWFDYERQIYLYIYPTEVLVNICFPYGPEIEAHRGRGRKVRLVIEETV